MKIHTRFGLLFATAVGSLGTAAVSQTPPVTPMTPDVMDKYEQVLPSADFSRREAMVPMRDGVKLYTVVVMKKGTSNAPILLSRTPYDAHKATHRVASQRLSAPLLPTWLWALLAAASIGGHWYVRRRAGLI